MEKYTLYSTKHSPQNTEHSPHGNVPAYGDGEQFKSMDDAMDRIEEIFKYAQKCNSDPISFRVLEKTTGHMAHYDFYDGNKTERIMSKSIIKSAINVLKQSIESIGLICQEIATDDLDAMQPKVPTKLPVKVTRAKPLTKRMRFMELDVGSMFLHNNCLWVKVSVSTAKNERYGRRNFINTDLDHCAFVDQITFDDLEDAIMNMVRRIS